MALENLNLDNFWNRLMSEFPESTKDFCKWIDKYKEDNHWTLLFNSRIKFHHLPLEMQTGIIFKYFSDKEIYLNISIVEALSMFEGIHNGNRSKLVKYFQSCFVLLNAKFKTIPHAIPKSE